MGGICHYLPVIAVSSTPQLHLHLPKHKTHFKNPNVYPKSNLGISTSFTFRGKNAKFGSKPNDPIEAEPTFMDENGVVDDMDGYLNSLSLEYDSVWDTKPSWCQPWTIALTGVSVIACSWLVLHSVIITALASSLICTWWYIFLYSYPKAYTEMIAERRKKVTSGMEDTYGYTKNQ